MSVRDYAVLWLGARKGVAGATALGGTALLSTAQHHIDGPEHLAASDITDLDASTTAHGLLRKLDGTSTHYLSGSGAWSTPPGFANPMTTQDDIIVGGSAGAPGRLAKGSDGQVLTVDPTTHHLLWATPSAASFATPAIVLGSSAAGGAASTVIRSDATIAAFDATAPTTQAIGDAAAVGTAAFAARRDHKHAITNPLTTQDDLWIGGASGAPARLAKGSDSQVLTVDPSTHHLVWATPTGGGAALTVEEVDGSPTDSAITKIVFPNGTLGIASHVATYTPAGGGGGGSGAGVQAYLGKNAVGASWETLTTNRIYWKKFVLAVATRVEQIDVYLRASTDNIASLNGMLALDNSNAPGVLIAGALSSLTYLSNSGSMPGAGRWFSFPVGQYLAAGTYWAGFNSDQARYDVAYDTGGSDQYFTPSGFYETGAYTSAWTITTGSRDYSIRIDTTVMGTSIRSNPLDRYAINATYGDDYTAAALSGIWTRRNFTSGAESYQQGPEATYMRIAFTGRANGDGYFQPAPAGDWTFACAFIPRFYDQLANHLWGIAVIDTNGTGVWLAEGNGTPAAIDLLQLTTYSSYGGSYVEAGYNGAAPNVSYLSPSEPSSMHKKIWLRLRKSGTNYYGSFSLDGELWGVESSALAWAGTVDRIGWILGPLSAGTITNGYIDLDWFNKIA